MTSLLLSNDDVIRHFFTKKLKVNLKKTSVLVCIVDMYPSLSIELKNMVSSVSEMNQPYGRLNAFGRGFVSAIYRIIPTRSVAGQ